MQSTVHDKNDRNDMKYENYQRHWDSKQSFRKAVIPVIVVMGR